jgi:hypothetical protein
MEFTPHTTVHTGLVYGGSQSIFPIALYTNWNYSELYEKSTDFIGILSLNSKNNCSHSNSRKVYVQSFTSAETYAFLVVTRSLLILLLLLTSPVYQLEFIETCPVKNIFFPLLTNRYTVLVFTLKCLRLNNDGLTHPTSQPLIWFLFVSTKVCSPAYLSPSFTNSNVAA